MTGKPAIPGLPVNARFLNSNACVDRGCANAFPNAIFGLDFHRGERCDYGSYLFRDPS
jgi:hypothetical protein